MNILPAYCFPSTVFLIDDDAVLLSTLLLKLEKGNFHQTSSKPLEALSFLKTYESAPIKLPHLMDAIESDETDRAVLDLNFNSYLKCLETAERFKEISVLIVDYTMPEINGVDLITQLKDKPFKKILLTGELDQGIAVRAFNDGLIDRYISKNTDIFPLLNTYVKELQIAYFAEKSKDLFNFVIPAHQIAQTEAFKKIFQSLLEKHKIVEYYLLNHTGAFLLLDAQGKMYYLALQSEADLIHYADIAIDNEASPTTINALKDRKSMPVFMSEMDHHKSVEGWNLQTIQPLQIDSNNLLYYSFFELSPEQYQTDKPIVSLANYQASKKS
jgi:CheY-like chemotaxis protein